MSTSNKKASKKFGIFSIGHSTRALDEFIKLLKAYGIRKIVDIRTIPRSWYNPQYNKETLPLKLAQTGISYKHMPGLGGLRHAASDSINKAWRNASFRGFADYMQTREFVKSLKLLVGVAKRSKSAIMCAEAVPWRCHRSLVADALLIRHIEVTHIMGLSSSKAHLLTPWAKVKGLEIWYPGKKGIKKR